MTSGAACDTLELQHLRKGEQGQIGERGKTIILLPGRLESLGECVGVFVVPGWYRFNSTSRTQQNKNFVAFDIYI